MRKFTCWIAALVIGGSSLLAYGQDKDLKDSLLHQFTVTQVTRGSGEIANAGTVVVLQKGGLMMYSTASPLPPANTYKNGKISQGGSGFGRDILITMAAPGSGTATDYPHRQFSAGEKLWIVALGVQKNDIVFRLYSDPVDGVRYYAELKFPGDKGPVPTLAQAMARISEALTIDQGSDSANPAAGTVPTGAGATQQPTLCAQYFMEKTDSQLQLNPDGSFSMRAATGQISPGHYSVNGDSFVLTYNATGRSSTYKIQGDKMFATTGAFWAPQGTCTPVSMTASALPHAAPPIQEQAPVAVPAATLKLPSTYVSSQSPDDHLQLNADNSFSLQEGGQPYHGNFVVNGNSLELTIGDTGTKNTVSLQGNNLVDGSGQTWIYRDQPIPSAPTGDMLKNADVLKMTKAGFDDETIIAKIKTSACKFDTSPDALIQLKQGGVRPAVLKAMIGAAK